MKKFNQEIEFMDWSTSEGKGYVGVVLRDNPRFDYRALHNRGVRIPIIGPVNNQGNLENMENRDDEIVDEPINADEQTHRSRGIISPSHLFITRGCPRQIYRQDYDKI